MYKSTYINLVYKPMSAYRFTFINLPQEDRLYSSSLNRWKPYGSPSRFISSMVQKSGDHNLGCTKTTNLRFA